MPKLPGVNHLDSVRALEKTGFASPARASTFLPDGKRILTIPRANPVNIFTLGGIVRDAGRTIEEFKNCCRTATQLLTRSQSGTRSDITLGEGLGGARVSSPRAT